jgi:peroxiredoxin
MAKTLADGKIFVTILIGSALLNIGLAHKVQQQKEVLLKLKGGNVEAKILGAGVNQLNVTDLNGKPTTISFVKNDPPTILYVFRPTCGWCAKNLPNLQAMQAAISNQRFRLVGISLDDHDLKQYVDSAHFTFPVYSNLASGERVRLNMGATPQTIMIANNIVVRNWEGAYTPDLKTEIEATLGIKLPGINTTPPSTHF